MSTATPSLSVVPLSDLLNELGRRLQGGPAASAPPSPTHASPSSPKNARQKKVGQVKAPQPKSPTATAKASPPSSPGASAARGIKAPASPSKPASAKQAPAKAPASRPSSAPKEAAAPSSSGIDAALSPEGIKALRASLGMTQVQFAKALGVNAVSVYGYETRDRKGKPRQRPTRASVLARLEKLQARASKPGKRKK